MSNQPAQPDQPPQPPQPPGGTQPPTPPGAGYGAPPSGPGYGAPAAGGYGAPSGQLSPQDERTWGMLAHISAILAAIVVLSFLGPLIVLLVQGNKSPFVRRQAIEALNFQITTYIAAIISLILIIVVIGFFMLIAVGIAWLVFTIMAGIKANNGEEYRYPLNLRLVK